MNHGFESEETGSIDGPSLELAPLELHCWFFSIDEKTSDALLSSDERERAERFRFDRDRRRFIAGRDSLRRILSRYAGEAPENLALIAEDGGRPRLKDRDVNFNYSRSGGWGLLAVADTGVLGADLEAVRMSDDLAAVARQNFSPAELTALSALSGEAWLAGFYRCWTRKEAVVKAMGTGLSAPLASFDVTLRPDQPAAIMRADGPSAPAGDWRLRAFDPIDGYCAAIATDLAAPKLHFLRVTSR